MQFYTAARMGQIGSAKAAYTALLKSSLKWVIVVLSGLEGAKRIKMEAHGASITLKAKPRVQ
jgi:hypothetical protein